MKHSWRLTPQQKREIAMAYVRGTRVQTIADRYGVSPAMPGILAQRLGFKLRTTERREREMERA